MVWIETGENETLQRVMDYVSQEDHIEQYWRSQNVVAKQRMGYNDHGKKHVHIVADRALRILRLLNGVEEPSIVKDYGLTFDDAEVVVTLAALLHDTGHIVHRYKHSEYSLFIANNLVEEILADIYTKRQIVIMKGEILHAIQSHHRNAKPLTLEAGILRVADALDMEKGRAGPPENGTNRTIHSISALSIEEIHIQPGDERPVLITIEMSNSSGIFQLDQLAREKIEGSGLEELVRVRAKVEGEEKKIVDEYVL